MPSPSVVTGAGAERGDTVARMNIVSRFLIWSAGASAPILEKCPGHERLRYESIGATVVMTGVFAALSGGYAVQRIGHSYVAAVIVGVIWGITIFNLDRIFVSGFRVRQGKGSRWLTFFRAMPRIALAALIALAISKPLEVRIVEERLNAQLIEMRDDTLAASKAKLATTYGTTALEGEVTQAHETLEKLAFERDALPATALYVRLVDQHGDCRSAANSLKAAHDRRINGLSGEAAGLTRDIRTNGQQVRDLVRRAAEAPGTPAAAELRAGAERLRATQRLLEGRRSDVNRQIGVLRAEVRSKVAECDAIQRSVVAEEERHQEDVQSRMSQWSSRQKEYAERLQAARIEAANMGKGDAENLKVAFSENFVAQIEALDALEKKKPVIRRMGWLLWSLFALLECAPILVKMLTPSGPYDAAIDAADRRFYSTNG